MTPSPARICGSVAAASSGSPLDDKAKEKIRQEVLEPIVKDNCRARDLGSDGNYLRRAPISGEPSFDGQQTILDRLARRGLHAVPDEQVPAEPEQNKV